MSVWSLQDQKEIEPILSVPSINNIFTAIGILSEIGADMNVFPSAKHLCSWAGLTPANNESAGKKKSVRISRAGNIHSTKTRLWWFSKFFSHIFFQSSTDGLFVMQNFILYYTLLKDIWFQTFGFRLYLPEFA